MIHPLYYSKIFVDERILIPLSRIFRSFDQWCKNLISLLDTAKTTYLWMVRKIQSVFLMTILLNQELVIKAGSRDVVSPDWKVVCLQGWIIKRLPHFIRIRLAFQLFFFNPLLCNDPVAQRQRICLQCRRHRQEMRVQSLGQEDPLEKGNGNPLQYSCLEKSQSMGLQNSQTWLGNLTTSNKKGSPEGFPTSCCLYRVY